MCPAPLSARPRRTACSACSAVSRVERSASRGPPTPAERLGSSIRSASARRIVSATARTSSSGARRSTVVLVGARSSPRSSPRNAMAYVLAARSSTTNRSDPRRQLDVGLAVGLDADRHQDEIAERAVVRRVHPDDALRRVQALALERHPQPRQSSRQLASRIHGCSPSGIKKDLPFLGGPLWFRLRCSLRGLGLPPSVVPAPNKELHNDDTEDD